MESETQNSKWRLFYFDWILRLVCKDNSLREQCNAVSDIKILYPANPTLRVFNSNTVQVKTETRLILSHQTTNHTKAIHVALILREEPGAAPFTAHTTRSYQATQEP